MMKPMKKILFIAFLMLPLCGMAQDNIGKRIVNDIRQNTTFGGYIITKYNYYDRKGDNKNGGFNIRRFRVYVDSRILDDFYVRGQMQISGSPHDSGENGAHLLDAFIEWQKYQFARVKLGQFDRGFTFEEPMNPWKFAFHDNSQVVNMLAGMTDRVGEHYSNGRDIGLQVQGDFLPVGKDQHNLIHYQAAVFNGQGINHGDANKKKDLIGTFNVQPVKDLYLGVYGWAGNYTKDGITVDRNRWGVGVDYERDWIFRAEYIASEGHKISDYDITAKQLRVGHGTDKADGWYAAVGVPVTRQCKVYGKWDVYRDQKTHDSQKAQYCLSGEYYLMKNLKFQLNYYYTDDRSATIGQHYNTIDLQAYFRF